MGARLAPAGLFCNAQMDARTLARHCALSPPAAALLHTALRRLDLSARAYTRILKVARTIADLDGSDAIAPGHVAEAVHYRTLERTRPDP